ncbi:MAG: hypothetical protein HY361_01560 [Candidatus Aenigmarchaeota archaeon]|nr:hypothetical protein [Candidatus Aenigmarchaeota archaeon]
MANEVLNHPAVTALIRENIDLKKELGLFANLEKIKLPYVMKDVTLMAPGLWNQVNFSADVIAKGTFGTLFNKENSSVFLNHEDNSVATWVGDITNIRFDSATGKQIGDLNVIDKETAMKLAYGAKFGISPKIEANTDAQNNLLDFKVLNYSIVVNPAIKDAYINKDEGEAIMSEQNFAKWDVAFINNLPDSAFLYIKDGGKKDDEGKTVPRTLRYFPYKDTSGNVDLPHLRNAIARAPQADVPASVVKEVQAKARSILEKMTGGEKKMSEQKFMDEEHIAMMKKLLDMTSIGEMKAVIQKMLDAYSGGGSKPETMSQQEFGSNTPLKQTEAAGDGNTIAEKTEKLDVKPVTAKMSHEIKELEEAAGKLSQAYAVIQEKENLIGKFSDEIKTLRGQLKSYEDAKQMELDKVRHAQFSKDVDTYAKFYGKTVDEVSKKLATFSDDVRTQIISDIQEKESQLVSVDVGQTGLNSEQLNSVATMSQTNNAPEMSRDEKVKYLFKQLKK